MSHPYISPTMPTIAQENSQDSDQSLLSRLYSLLPAADSTPAALQLLLDAEYQIRLSLDPDSPLLNGSATNDAKLLGMAKFTLLRALNPAWGPIMDQCELKLLDWVVYAQNNMEGTIFTDVDDHQASGSNLRICDSKGNISSGMESILQSVSPLLPSTALQSLGEASQVPNIDDSRNFGDPTSSYSSLLPEMHCPPFANMDDDYPRSSQFPNDVTSPCTASLYLTPENRESQAEQQAPVVESYSMPDNSQSLQDFLSLFLEHSEYSLEDFTQPTCGSPEGSSSTIQQSTPSQLSQLEESLQEQALDMGTSKRHKRRAFDRPPGLPLGPWTPSDPTPFPDDLPSKKPRHGWRLREPGPTSNDTRKVSCPDCHLMLLPTSLRRHRKRHSNLREEPYDTHLYCRYCFSPYARMDSLVFHQKTEARCVQLQYNIYWKERHAYLDEAFRKWDATIARARQ